MARPATGWIKWRKHAVTGAKQWHVQLTLKGGKRSPWVPLDPTIPEEDRPRAQACATLMSADARVHGLVGAEVRETFGEWFARFHAHKEAMGLASVKDMRGRAKKWILPGLDTKDVRALTRVDMEAIVRRLDVALAAFMKGGPGVGRLSPSSARNIWADLVHALNEAVRAKDPSLRVLTDSPARNVRGPEAGDDRQGQILYSDEIVALLRGVSVDPSKPDVPLYRRQTYALAIYTKGRSSEVEALTARDVDLAHGTFSISKQADRWSTGRLGTKATKTKHARSPDIEPNLRPLLEWLVKHPQGPGKRLVRMPQPDDRACLLRKDLLTVGVTRAALHIEGDAHQRALTFHDLRDTGLVHMAIRGDSPIVIQWSGGHQDFKTTQGYIERGKVEARRIGAPLPPLPPGLTGPSAEASPTEPDDAPEGSALVSLQSEIALARSRDSLPFREASRETNCSSLSDGDTPARFKGAYPHSHLRWPLDLRGSRLKFWRHSELDIASTAPADLPPGRAVGRFHEFTANGTLHLLV